jgi:uncharacterized protein YbjT (DUF2867 family)
MRVLISGASGLVGSSLLEELLQHPKITKVYSFVRTNSGRIHEKLIEELVDFSCFQTFSFEGEYECAFCCLGTTLRKAGSKDNQFKIDHDYVLNFAQFAKEEGVHYFGVVSSLGAKTPSSNFYLDTKGKMENSLKALEFDSLTIIRPSFLLGERKEFRLMEKISTPIIRFLGLFFFGKMKKYKGVQAKSVAKKLIEATLSNNKGVVVIESNEIN